MTPAPTPLSPEYRAALRAHDAAIRAYEKIRAAYNARTIGDAEFLAARVQYDAACAAFDTAFAKEAGWTQ